MKGKTVSYHAVRTANFDGNGKHEGKGYLSINGKITGYTEVQTTADKNQAGKYQKIADY